MVKKKPAKRTDSQIPPVEVIDTEGMVAAGEEDLDEDPDSEQDEDLDPEELGEEQFSDGESELSEGDDHEW